ncbi:MAG: STAS domain-containing protein [Solirubrobacteraceae bacterium]
MLRGADSAGSSHPTQPSFGISRRELDTRTSVIAVEGDLDLATAPQLKWMLVDALEEGHSQLILDLTLASFMDSTALGVLVGVNRSLDDGVKLAIVCAHAGVLRIFELSGVDGAFAISPTLESALAGVHARAADATHAVEAG